MEHFVKLFEINKTVLLLNNCFEFGVSNLPINNNNNNDDRTQFTPATAHTNTFIIHLKKSRCIQETCFLS
jgi:hypothetical protein